ncbi:acetyl-CoA carboxylase-like isoform X3 [Dermacentor silvarum]|uniref:acetyl-CoA carboxylase-like isoform X3 n=1 Tax=Dermacentor silvarum TaxID=543639 RepID=UPI0021017796|nr:acetyl-CoA carboxylase-like isoform X3 [Dermacentor silvarum]
MLAWLQVLFRFILVLLGVKAVRRATKRRPRPPEAPSEMNGTPESKGRTDLQRLESLAAHNGVNTSPVRIVVEPCWDDEGDGNTITASNGHLFNGGNFNGFGNGPRPLFTIDCSDEETDDPGSPTSGRFMGDELRRNRSRAKLFRQSMSGAHLSNEDRDYGKGQKDFIVATPEEFVSRFGGRHIINKVLIANNGIAAVKCMRSIRRWAYEMFSNDKAVRFVVMVTPEDLNANAEYIKLADHCVPVPGGSNNNNYANVDLILDIAKRVGAQAVWAGWGHASENPRLPELLTKNKIAFIGPPEKAMWALGDKIASSIVAQTANVPTLPWSGSGLKASDWGEDDVYNPKKPLKIKPELYRKGCVTGVDDGLEAAQRIGFPVMIKASEGGGGKGIRKSESANDFPQCFRQVQSEVPGSPIFIMKLATCARHLEVQLLADQYGTAISLFGRDCSIQRRHQKIIEEAPCIIATPPVLEQMERAAVRLAKMVGYVSAGTVEYLYSEDGKFYFLELNPRLQVEHPCTEMVADVNLPACQLQIAMGVPLHRIKDIRLLYGESPWGESPIDFDNQVQRPRPLGHVIAARITSENPDEGFKPSAGTVQELNFRSNKNVWGYFSVGASGGLHEFADSQFGHCFSWGEDREEARENLVLALKELSIRGDFRTTVEYLITLLETDAFLSNTFDTGWLDKLIAERVQAEKPDTMLSVICGALHVAHRTIRENFRNFQTCLEKGQILPATTLTNTLTVDLIHELVKYTVQVSQCGPTSYFLVMNGSTRRVEAHRLSDDRLLLSIDGASYTTYMKEEVDRYRVVIGNQTCIFEKEKDPSVLRSPSTGKLLQFLVEDGAHVVCGQSYAEIEVMKMVMTLTVEESGCVHFIKRPGAVLEAGCELARLELDDPSRVNKAIPFEGSFPAPESEGGLHEEKLNQQFLAAKQDLENVLDGYVLPDPHFAQHMTASLDTFMRTLRDPTLPLMELKDIISSISGRIQPSVENNIRTLMKMYDKNITSVLAQFPSQQIAGVIDSYAATLQKRADRDVFFMTTQGIVQLVQRYRNGIRGRMKNVVQELLKQYLSVEIDFQQGHYDKCVALLREKHKDSMSVVVDKIFSHLQVAKKNLLIIKLIDHLCGHEPGLTDELSSILNELTTLSKTDNAKVALRARQVLIATHQPAWELRHNQMESIFLSAIDMYGHDFCPENLQKLILSETSIFDVLPDFFYHGNVVVQRAALEVYVRRAYVSYDLTCLQHLQLPSGICAAQFQFLLPSSHPNRQIQTPVVTDGDTAETPSTPEDTVSAWEHEQPDLDSQRVGIMAAFNTFDQFANDFDNLIEFFAISPNVAPRSEFDFGTREHSAPSFCDGSESPVIIEPMHILNIAIRNDIPNEDEDYAAKYYAFCQEKCAILKERMVRRITFLILHKRRFPQYYTFRYRDDYIEDCIYRHLEPALAFQLEINRLRNYDLEAIPTSNLKMHLYLGKAKVPKGQEVSDFRFFIRAIIRHSDLVTKEASYEYLQNEGERLLLEAMDELEVAFTHPVAKRTDCNHIFLNFVPKVTMDPARIAENVRDMVMRYGPRLWKLRVLQAEIKMTIRGIDASSTPCRMVFTEDLSGPGVPSLNGKCVPIRLFLANESGYYLDISLYKERLDPETGLMQFDAWGPHRQGPLHGLPISTPYLTKDYLQQKRFQAQSNGTTYVYDFPDMFRQALIRLWEEHVEMRPGQDIPASLLSCVELVMDSQGRLVEQKRLPGENDVGMVAWRMTLVTPEYPEGRDIIVIANDITFLLGTFGPQEDILFFKASERARALGIPRLYISANSGARIGLAEELKHLFNIAWVDPDVPDKGYRYLYLTPENFKKVSALNSVNAELIDDEGEKRYKITNIIGKVDGLGVENLKYAGLIAGETSQAYEEIVTISLVTCRAIGIGAYLVRLGQRVIQLENSHIILTGAGALNKLLGREVYTSNNQLGGVQIMYPNGVSHVTVHDDLEGTYVMLKWLSYMPKCKGGKLPIVEPLDPIDRDVVYTPSKVPYDPRWLLAGRDSPNLPGFWEDGFFDRGSFMEVMQQWAQTVVCGRARLGGIPVGVVAVETRTVEIDIPADPANLDSEAKVLSQAGQVWFPDSAYKTAQAINDFNREELPLFVFANWRGFSGGMKDMYDQVLKFGAYIVDALHTYRQPVIVYIPPYGELRGGAWAVVDAAINPRQMEMYADPDSRGGVLEPEGTVEIRFRKKDLLKTMHRVDARCREILSLLGTAEPEKKVALEAELRKRETQLLPMYHQVALSFADLHDMPARMQEKGVIQDVVPWSKSRNQLYWRLRRRLLQDAVKRDIQQVRPQIGDGEMESMLRRWFVESMGAVKVRQYLWENDLAVTNWLQVQLDPKVERSLINDNIQCLRRDAAISQIKTMLQANTEVIMASVLHVIQQLTPQQRSDLLATIRTLEHDLVLTTALSSESPATPPSDTASSQNASMARLQMAERNRGSRRRKPS